MTDDMQASGTGQANDATVEVVENDPAARDQSYEEAKAAKQREQTLAQADRAVAAAEAKVARLQEHLAGAEAGLAEAQAARAALDGQEA